MRSETKSKWLMFLGGFAGWFLVSTLAFAMAQASAEILWLFYLPINVLVIVILAFWKRTQWITLGIMSAMTANFFVAAVLRPFYEAICFFPVTYTTLPIRPVTTPTLALPTVSIRRVATLTPGLPAVPSNRWPLGFHDGSSGQVDQVHCVVFGWTFDPDDRAENLPVRVLVDGEVVAQKTAGIYRPDLTGPDGCSGGSCGFLFDLWSLISHNEQHTILVQAQDLQTDNWKDLSSTPKTLNCEN